ncbi:multidrug efflux transporter permease subunit MdtO [Burkholderia sp. Ac-20353]|uniref:multidrug efflux transporter permease subunit MdtO n=1 Tax=Burkholderia sp. Ac-20353 TaxID=2703894 RepID=UPI00197C17ED|nr:multidrug efflux transporter permease subunit MdtO [Burkholderia sp. Ac-20353]MBN3789777.1 multidrug efflux transporter permease subunit MdtO [Burkholderia sp. Ac-20353]
MNAEPLLSNRLQRLATFVGGEIRPYPGRMNVTLRCVLASAIVIVTSMALQVPLLAVSLIVVFYVTQANVVVTRLIGTLFVIGSTVAVGSAILVFKFTYDYPLLRILLAAALFFVSVYMMRVARIGVVFFIIGLVVIYAQTFVDRTDQAELLVRAVLWLWVAVNYAIALTLVINTLFLPAEPVRQLHAAMCGQLDAIDASLAALERGTAATTGGPGPDARQIQAGALTLQKLLRFATMRDAGYRANRALHLARVATVSRLYAATGHLPASTAGWTADAIPVLRDACRALGGAIRTGARFVAPRSLVDLTADGLPGALAEMRDALLAFADRSAAPPAVQSPAEKERLLVPDAVTNPVYAQFALKTLMAALFSYVFYIATDWPGIHTMMLSCLIVAQPSLGATTQRAVLRIGGAAVGSVLALAMVVWVVPHLDGIVGLLMMALPVIALGAWVSAGSERISYAGIQIMFTFALALLEQFGPTTNLTEIRDRMLGILLGVVVSTVIHACLWPEAEGEALRQRAAKLLRRIGEHLRTDATGPVPVGLWAELGDHEAMSARVALEPGWQMADGEHEGLTLRMQTLLARIREILLATDAFGAERRSLKLPDRTATAATAFQAELATLLDGYAHALAEHPLAIEVPPRATVDALSECCAADLATQPADALRAAYDRLLTRAGNLANQISGLPAWAPEPAVSAFTSRASQA